MRGPWQLSDRAEAAPRPQPPTAPDAMVLEGLLVSILQRHLGQFLDSDLKALKANLWKGKMSMKNVALRPDALYALGLPLSVKAGRIDLLEIDIPWRRIGKEVSPLMPPRNAAQRSLLSHLRSIASHRVSR